MSRWIPFHIARPLLDRKPYVVLSDFATSKNGESSPPHVSEDFTEMQRYDIHQDTNELGVEMIDNEYGSSDDDLGSDSDVGSFEKEDNDIGDILIELKSGRRLRYKVCKRFQGHR